MFLKQYIYFIKLTQISKLNLTPEVYYKLRVRLPTEQHLKRIQAVFTVNLKLLFNVFLLKNLLVEHLSLSKKVICEKTCEKNHIF